MTARSELDMRSGGMPVSALGVGTPDGRGVDSIVLRFPDRPRKAEGVTRRYPVPLLDLAFIINAGRLTEDQVAHVTSIENTDWSKTRLDMSDPDHRSYVAKGIADGGVAVHGLGYFYGVTMLPHIDVVRSVNASKGRPLDQVASAFPIHEQIVDLGPNGEHQIFDLTHLPEGMTPELAIKMMDKLLSMGPFGFQGKTSLHDYPLLLNNVKTKDGEEYKTIQIIAPGKEDEHANDIARQAMALSGAKVLAITSANRSHHQKGTKEEPAHWEMRYIQEDFGNVEANLGYPYMMIGHDEEAALVSYPKHRPMSTSIVSFHEKLPMFNGRPTVSVVRRGSMDVGDIAEALDELGINVIVAPGKAQRLGERPRNNGQLPFSGDIADFVI